MKWISAGAMGVLMAGSTLAFSEPSQEFTQADANAITLVILIGAITLLFCFVIMKDQRISEST